MLLVLAVALASVLLVGAPVQAKKPTSSLAVAPTAAIPAERLTFRGVVPSKARVRPVQLQRYVGHRWVRVASSHTTTRGVFRFVSRAPGSAGRFRYRVLAPRAKIARKRLQAARTPTRVVTVVRQRATLATASTNAVQGAVTLTARFYPARLGRRVQFQQFVSGAWRAVRMSSENRTGVAAATDTPLGTATGPRSYRAVALARSGAGAFASPTQVALPQLNAVDTTPRVVDDSVVTESGVRELRQVGSTMYAGGAFNTVHDAAGTTSYTRTNLFSFDADTGAVSSWAPAVNGPVYTLEASADGRYLYVGGDFTSFDGSPANHLVKYDLQLGAVDTTFASPLTSVNRVSDLQLVGARLFVGGTFPGGIAALDPATGVKSTYFDPVQASGSETDWQTRVYRFALNPAATRMVVIGSFTSIGADLRQQVAMIQLGPSTTSVSPWASTRWDEDCAPTLQWYSRAVAWSPDGRYFTIGTTGSGFPGTTKLCDTVTRWNPVEAAGQEPVWIQYSGGDTFQSVTVTSYAVFTGGHFRWLDNPLGRDYKAAGAVDRLGLAALDPTTGKALPWNPTKSVEGGNGAFDLYFTGRGLWVAHFEQYLGTGPSGRELHEGLGLLPY